MNYTTKEAIDFVKKAKGKFFLHVRIDADVVDKPWRVFPHGLHSYLRLSRKDALHLVSTCLTATLEARGGRIRISEAEEYDGTINYWIG